MKTDRNGFTIFSNADCLFVAFLYPAFDEKLFSGEIFDKYIKFI